LPDVALTFSSRLHVEAIPTATYDIYVHEEKKQYGQFDNDGRADFSLAVFSEFVRGTRKDEILVSMTVFANNEQYQLPLLKILKVRNGANGEASGAVISKIPAGQPVIHPNYGLGILELFAEKHIEGLTIPTARFHFERHETVQFFIPVTRRIPLYLR